MWRVPYLGAMTLNPETKYIYLTSFNNNETIGNDTVKKKKITCLQIRGLPTSTSILIVKILSPVCTLSIYIYISTSFLLLALSPTVLTQESQ